MKSHQKLRLQRFLSAFLTYLVVSGIIFYDSVQGFNRLTLFWIAVLFSMVLIANMAFYVAFRTGWNRRFRDPSLTMPQMVVGVLLALICLYFTDKGRGVLLMFMLLPFLFGVFSQKTGSLLRLTAFALIGYGMVILLLIRNHPESIDPHLETAQLIVLGFVLTWISILCGHVSRIRMNLVKTNRKLAQTLRDNKRLAEHDELTGLFNRRGLNEILDHEIALVERGGAPFQVCLLDLDHFKRINDVYGHLNGDLVLARFARFLSESLRKTDYCTRYGGEEFLAILTATTAEGALTCMEKIRVAAHDLVFEEIDNSLKVTTCVGVATYVPGEPIEDTLARADKALYQCKGEGRDRVAYRGTDQEPVDMKNAWTAMRRN